MKKANLSPEIKSASTELLAGINRMIKKGMSTIEAIRYVSPLLCSAYSLEITISENAKIGQYGAKVSISNGQQCLVLKF